MKNESFAAVIETNRSPKEVFEAITNVRGWWCERFAGKSAQLDDEFEVRFADVHYSKQKVVEYLPGMKLAWLITDSQLNFLKDKSEWTGTKISFNISAENGRTRLHFLHEGLTPAVECFRDCSNGWDYFLHQSLLPLINTGKGNPNILEEEIAAKTSI